MSAYIPPGSQPPPEPHVHAPHLDDTKPEPAAAVLDIALMLATRGLAVFPCAASKRPAIPEVDGGRGCLDATTDPEQVRALFARAPIASLVGVACGPASGFDILDIDPRHGGDAWEQQNQDHLPETLIHSTRGGGRHHVFRHHPRVRNRQAAPVAGVDVRGAGGYAIWPPSAGYEVVHDAEPAEWPQWLLGQIIRTEPPPRPIARSNPTEISDARLDGLLRSLLARLGQAPEGQKHEVLLRIARTIGGYAHLLDMSDDQSVALMLDALPDTVLDWRNAEKTARDGLAYGRTAPLELEDRPNPRQHRDTEQPPAADEVPPGWQDAHPLAEGDITVPGDPLLTEQVAMEAFIAGFRTDLRFNHSSGSWLVWNNHNWKPDQRKLAFAWALKLCRQLASQGVSAKGRLVVEKVRFSAAVEQGARAMPPFSTAQEDWDANPMLLGTPGGVVDLKTGELCAGERSDMITKTTACTPVSAPDCPLWLAFLDFVMGSDDQRIHFIQRFCGYCLTGLTTEEVLLFLFGIAGSGKSTLVETLSGILGDYAASAPMEVFTGVSWAPTEYYRANMAGRRLIVAAEPERGAFWAEAFVKSITGGDKMSGRHPAGRPFDFEPTHKPLLHGNHMPRLRGRSTAMERRLLILLFNLKPETPDRQLKAKLRTEWPAILRWMIEGALAWQRIGLDPPDTIRAANTSYFEAQNVFGRWIDECCILDRSAEHAPDMLRTSFNRWAKANGEDEMNGNAFSEALDQFEANPPLTRGRTKGKRWVKGLRLVPTSPTE